MLNLFGWDQAQVGGKARDFAGDSNALGGISMSLRQLDRGSFVLANKPSRVERISNMLRSEVEDGFITRNRASEIQGHLNFCSGILQFQGFSIFGVVFGKLGRYTQGSCEGRLEAALPLDH